MPSEHVPQVRGVRGYVQDYLLLCHYYLKYKDVIDPLIPAEVAAAMTVLCSFADSIKTLNTPGPF